MVLPYKELIKLAALHCGEKQTTAGESENILGVHTNSQKQLHLQEETSINRSEQTTLETASSCVFKAASYPSGGARCHAFAKRLKKKQRLGTEQGQQPELRP